MDLISKIDDLTRTTRRRDFDDGLTDLFFSFTFLFIGLFTCLMLSEVGIRWFIRSILWNRELAVIAWLALIPFFVLLLHGIRKVIAWIRQKVIWKDRGTITPLSWQVSRGINLVAVLVFVLGLSLAVWFFSRGWISQQAVLRFLVIDTGLVTGIVFYGMGKDLLLRRYQIVGILGSVLNLLIVGLPLSFSQTWLVFGIIWMLILLFSGAWALRKTLQRLREQKGD